MSWAGMVVVAVRDPDAGRRRLALRLLLTAGIATAAFLTGLLLGSCTAFADDTTSETAFTNPVEPNDGEHARARTAEPSLLALVTGTLTALTDSLEHGTAEAAELTELILEPGKSTPDEAEITIPQSQPVSAEISPRTDTRPDFPAQVAAEPLEVTAAPGSPAPRPPAHHLKRVTTKRTAAQPSRDAPPPLATPGDEQATPEADPHRDLPTPVPGKTGDHATGSLPVQDGGGAKHPFAVPGARPAPANLPPAGLPELPAIPSGSTSGALPLTSPD